MRKPKIVFFGTPEYVLPILTSLHKSFVSGAGVSPIAAVVTQKPAPAGREQKITYSPVDKWAHEHKVQIFYKAEDIVKENIDADLGVCASFGEIIPKSVISHLKFGILNIHPSLLPKYRGASPVQETILSADEETGVTIIKMDEQVDHGPIISRFKDEIKPDDTTETLRARLFEKSAEVLTQLIEPYLQGKITSREQNHKEATFTKRIKKEDGFINLTIQPSDPLTIYNFIRAMQPWPGAWTNVKTKMANGQWLKKRLKILRAHLDISHKQSLALRAQSLVIDTVQLEGKSPVSYDEFKRGYPNAEFVKD